MPDPLNPVEGQQSLDQRLTNELTSLRDRLDSIRLNRPTTSANTTTPSAPALPGTRHMDTDDRRFYVYTGTEWISADSQRAAVTDAATVSTAGGKWQSLSGPNLGVFISDPAVVLVHVDVEMMGNAWACGIGTCLSRAEVGLVDNRWNAATRVARSTAYNVWERRVNTGYQEGVIGAGTSDSDGAPFPRGGFAYVWLETPGTYTFSLVYASIDESVGGGQPAQNVSFKNRTIHALIL